MNVEQTTYNLVLSRLNFILKVTGIYIDYEDEHRNLFQRLIRRWFLCLGVINNSVTCIGLFGLIKQSTVQDITRLMPGLVLSVLGDCKAFFFIKEHHHVVDLIRALRRLQGMGRTSGEVEKEMTEKLIPFFYRSDGVLLMMGVGTHLAFCVFPLVPLVVHLIRTGEFQPILLFETWFPFDAHDYRIWPFIILHQHWTSILAHFCLFGSDCFFRTSCAFVHVQLRTLCQDARDMARAVRHDRGELASTVKRHQELIRCVDLLEQIYGKSTLLNVMSSSFIICIVGFHLLIVDDLMNLAPFAPFLMAGSLQIYLFCYYGDLVMQDSIDLSDAVYETEWYDLDIPSMKSCLFMIARAQKPCKITAYGFADINMKSFASIMSSSWSYFTLLRTMFAED